MRKIVKHLFLLLLLPIFFFFFVHSASASGNFTFSGVLRNGTGVPIPNARVVLGSSNTNNYGVTGSDGYFSVNVTSGTYSLNVCIDSSQGLIVPSLGCNSIGNASVTVNGDMVQDLTVPTITLSVMVVDFNGTPVPGATAYVLGGAAGVSFFPGSGTTSVLNIGNTAITDASGIARMAVLPSQGTNMTLSVIPPSGSTLSNRYELIGFLSDSSITVNLAATYAFSGILRNGTSMPIPNARVDLRNSSFSGRGVTGSDGSFSINVPSGTYSICVAIDNPQGLIAPSYFGCNSTSYVNITVNGDMVQDLTLPTIVLSVTVVDPDGTPVPGATAYVLGGAAGFPLFLGAANTSPNNLVNTAITDASGVARMAVLPSQGTNMTLNVIPPSGSTLSNLSKLVGFADTESLFASYTSPAVGVITAPTAPVPVNTSVTASANFTEQPTTTTHTAIWDWGDGSITTGTVTETNGSGSGSVSDTHTYTSAGVYTITLTVIDNYDGRGTSTFEYVSVYNPTSQGLFSAGQKYTSPVGALTQDLSATGTVKFGLSYKYQGTMPVGTRQFSMDFNSADFHFNATTVSSLVISNGIGTLTGTGTVNSSGKYSFLVTGSESANTIRIQIKDASNNIVYDTQPGAADSATPTTAVTGNILAH